MRVIDRNMKFVRVCLCVAMILCVMIAPDRGFADDGTPSGTASSVKIDAPKPGLTEREQWLLDRVEQLERRVVELESKGAQPAEPPATASQPATKEAASGSAATGTASGSSSSLSLATVIG